MLLMTMNCDTNNHHQHRLADFDICCGRGKGKWNSPGNQRFKEVIQNFLPQYADATSKADKSRIVEAVVAIVQEGGGRFVKQDDTTGQWYPINPTETRCKVAHAIRDHLATFCKRRFIPTPCQAQKLKQAKRSTNKASVAAAAAAKKNAADNSNQSISKSDSGSECTPEPELSSSLVVQQQLQLHGNNNNMRTDHFMHQQMHHQQQHPMPLLGVGSHESLAQAAAGAASNTTKNTKNSNTQFAIGNANNCLYTQNLLSLRSRRQELLSSSSSVARIAADVTTEESNETTTTTSQGRRVSESEQQQFDDHRRPPSWLPLPFSMNQHPNRQRLVIAEDEKLAYENPIIHRNIHNNNLQDMLSLQVQPPPSLPQPALEGGVGALPMSMAEARFASGGWLSNAVVAPLEVLSHNNNPILPNVAHSRMPAAAAQQLPTAAVASVSAGHNNSVQQHQGGGWNVRNLPLNNLMQQQQQRIIQPIPAQDNDDHHVIADLEPNAVFPPVVGFPPPLPLPRGGVTDPHDASPMLREEEDYHF